MKIGIIAAMELELQNLKLLFSNGTIEKIAQNEFYSVSYLSTELILLCSGQGKTNSAMYTQILIDRFSPELILNIGICGGIGEHIAISDICVGTRYCHYDVRKKQSLYKFPNKLYYEGDRQVIDQLLRNDKTLKLSTFGTGESFIADEKQGTNLRNEFEIDCVDMESGAIAQCCYLNNTRFVSIRTVSDKGDKNAITITEDEQEKAMDKIFSLVWKYVNYLEKGEKMNNRKATFEDYNQIIAIWESSVIATHDFLSERDRIEIKKMMPTYLENLNVQLWYDSEVVGFSATDKSHLEMLFLDPSKRRKGYGKQILYSLMEDYEIISVDVNKDNVAATQFYLKNGFSILSESETDGEGRPYPILHLHL